MNSKICLFIFMMMTQCFLSACNVAGDIGIVDNTPTTKTGENLQPSKSYSGSKELSQGQYKVTAGGYKLNAQFYQISENKELANGYKVEGVFNE